MDENWAEKSVAWKGKKLVDRKEHSTERKKVVELDQQSV
jgi:hypothetical protein